jgi:hypothetical protein
MSQDDQNVVPDSSTAQPNTPKGQPVSLFPPRPWWLTIGAILLAFVAVYSFAISVFQALSDAQSGIVCVLMAIYPMTIAIGLWRQKRWAFYGMLTLLAIPIGITSFVLVRVVLDPPEVVDQEVVKEMFLLLTVCVLIASWFVANKRYFR